MLTSRSGKAATVGVITLTCDIPSGLTSRADVEVMKRAASWETVIDTFITTAAVRAMVAEATSEGEEDRTEVTAVMGVCTGVKGNHPTPHIPNMASGSSATTRPIMKEVCWHDQQGWGGGYICEIWGMPE